MSAATSQEPQTALGRSPDSLTLEERLAFAGKYVAYEIYTPKTLPLHTIDAIGDSLAECLRILKQRGLDPQRYEFRILPRPY
jgi:hypothetical protein